MFLDRLIRRRSGDVPRMSLEPDRDDPPATITARVLSPLDLDAAEWIEMRASDDPLDVSMLREIARWKYCGGLLAEIRNVAVGFVLYDLGYDSVHVVRLAVDPAFQRMGVGRVLMDGVKRRLFDGREAVRMDVPETDVGCHLFLVSQGFICDSIVHGVVGEPDIYEFLWKGGE